MYKRQVQGLVRVGEDERFGRRVLQFRRGQAPIRQYEPTRGERGVQEPVQGPSHGLVANSLNLVLLGHLTRVEQGQVVEPVISTGDVVQQIGIHQYPEQVPDARTGKSDRGGGRPAVERHAREEPEQLVDTRRLGW